LSRPADRRRSRAFLAVRSRLLSLQLAGRSPSSKLRHVRSINKPPRVPGGPFTATSRLPYRFLFFLLRSFSNVTYRDLPAFLRELMRRRPQCGPVFRPSILVSIFPLSQKRIDHPSLPFRFRNSVFRQSLCVTAGLEINVVKSSRYATRRFRPMSRSLSPFFFRATSDPFGGVGGVFFSLRPPFHVGI